MRKPERSPTVTIQKHTGSDTEPQCESSFVGDESGKLSVKGKATAKRKSDSFVNNHKERLKNLEINCKIPKSRSISREKMDKSSKEEK